MLLILTVRSKGGANQGHIVPISNQDMLAQPLDSLYKVKKASSVKKYKIYFDLM